MSTSLHSFALFFLETRLRLPTKLLITGAIIIVNSAIYIAQAQVITRRFSPGNQPQSIGAQGSIPTLTLPAVDVAALIDQDVQRSKDMHPYRFGTNLAVDIDLVGSGMRTETNQYRIYQYQLYAPGAYSLNLILDRLKLAPGAQLYLYDPAMTMQIGPITEKQNIQTGEFWSDLIQGERLIMELREPLKASPASQVHLRSVVHGYKNVFAAQDKAFGQSGSCEKNMACFPDYQFEGDGVVIILSEGGSAFCSGSIVNDSRQSFRSFLLSANHCGVPNNALIRFKYQSPACNSSTEPAETITLNGTDFRANYSTSDVSLRELKQQIPPEASATYLGWNRADANASNAFGIHHPEGDLKKISFTNADTQITGYNTPSGTTHLYTLWDNNGVTEPGSSGSPLFDGNRRVIGQLHGGPSSCGATGANRSDYYGRFFLSWTGGGTSSSRLSDWLDPSNQGNVVTNGAKPAVSGLATVTGSGSFSVNTMDASIVSWSIAGGTGVVSPTSGTGNMANLVVVSTANSLTITFSINAGQSYPIQFSREFNVINTCTLTASLSNNGPLTCAKTSVILTAGGGEAGATYAFSNGTSQPSGPTSSTASATQAAPYSVTVTNPNGCTASAITTVTSNTTAPTTGLTNNGPLSDNMPQVTLTATGGGTYAFSPGASQPSGPTSPTASVTQAGTYSVQVTSPNGCTASAQTIVTGATSQTVCRSSNAVITVVATGSALTYQWYKNGQTAANKMTEIASIQKGTTTSSLTLVNNQTVATYYLKATDGSGTVTWYGPIKVSVNANCNARLAAELTQPTLQIILAPNPLQNNYLRAVVSGAGGRSLTVQLTDLRGQPLRQQQWESAAERQVVEWELSAQSSGMYFVQAQATGGEGPAQSQTIKLIKP